MHFVPQRFVFIGRDGVINRRSPAAKENSLVHFEFMPRALEALRRLAANHFAAIVVSRQKSVAEGWQCKSDLEALTRRFLLEVALAGGHIAQVYYCTHKDFDHCHCFRPNGSLFGRAAAEHGFALADSYFVGEDEGDLCAAAAAGCRCLRIRRDAFLQPDARDDWSSGIASSLYEAAEHILAAETDRSESFIFGSRVSESLSNLRTGWELVASPASTEVARA